MFTIDDFSLAGTSPGLYTDEEIQNIVSAVMPGGVTTKRVDKIEIALERFLKKIRQNLHVVVCMNYRGRWIYLDLFSFDFFILQKKKFLRTAPSVLLPEAIKNPASIIIKIFA